MMRELLLVILGSGIGGGVRYSIYLLMKNQGYTLPWYTLLANVIATFCAALFSGLILSRWLAPEFRWLLVIGFCGGLSTFSTFSLEIMEMWKNGAFLTGIIYILLNLIVCLIAAWGGFWITKSGV